MTYKVNSEPLFTYACHCNSCQKRTGSAFSLGLVITTATLDLQGALALLQATLRYRAES
ncbi:MAG: GFA family protein [Halioglobus sp.]